MNLNYDVHFLNYCLSFVGLTPKNISLNSYFEMGLFLYKIFEFYLIIFI